MKLFYQLALFWTMIILSGSNCIAQNSVGFLESSRERIVDTGKPKEVVFKLIRSWAAKKYPSYKDISQIEDIEGGQLVFKPVFLMPGIVFSSFRYTVTVDIKDNKYRSTIDGVEVLKKGSTVFYDLTYESEIENIEKELEDLNIKIANTKRKRDLDFLNYQHQQKKGQLSSLKNGLEIIRVELSIIQTEIKESVLPKNSIRKDF